MLADATDYWLNGLPEAEHVCRRHWLAKVPFSPQAPTGGSRVAAYVSAGRWVVDCPDCKSAVLAPFTDRRFMCVECANRENDGRWRPVAWPDNRADIEFLLEMRPQQNQNWAPGETLAQLAKENMEHGVGGDDGATGNRILVP